MYIYNSTLKLLNYRKLVNATAWVFLMQTLREWQQIWHHSLSINVSLLFIYFYNFFTCGKSEILLCAPSPLFFYWSKWQCKYDQILKRSIMVETSKSLFVIKILRFTVKSVTTCSEICSFQNVPNLFLQQN